MISPTWSATWRLAWGVVAARPFSASAARISSNWARVIFSVPTVTTTASGGTVTAGLASLSAGLARLGGAGGLAGCCATESPAARSRHKYVDVLVNFIDAFIVARCLHQVGRKLEHMPRVGGIEAGGTKFVCAVGSRPDDLEVGEVPTTTPEETIRRTVEFFRAHRHGDDEVSAIGIGSFGPIDPNPASPTFGYITATPKLAWRNFNFAGAIRESLGAKVAFDTDVNAAALGGFRGGAAQNLDTFLYLTVGTGIGGGGMVNGGLMHGRTHPEMGHIRIPHGRGHDPFAGRCAVQRDS